MGLTSPGRGWVSDFVSVQLAARVHPGPPRLPPLVLLCPDALRYVQTSPRARAVCSCACACARVRWCVRVCFRACMRAVGLTRGPFAVWHTVVGVLRSSVEELQEMSRNMEDVVIVDLDDDRVIPPGSQDTDAALLPPFVAPLRATIEDVSKRTRNRMTLTNLSSNSNRKVRTSPHPGSGLHTDFRRRRGCVSCVPCRAYSCRRTARRRCRMRSSGSWSTCSRRIASTSSSLPRALVGSSSKSSLIHTPSTHSP